MIGWTLLVCISIIATTSESARFLAFFPLPGRTHHFIYRGVMEELAKRGHELLYVTSVPYKEPPKGIEQIDLSMYTPIVKEFHPVTFGEYSIKNIVWMEYRIGFEMAPDYLGDKRVQELIHSDQKFDAVLFESYFVQEYLSALIHKFDCIGIDISPLGENSWVHELSGLPDNTANQLDYKSELTNPMSFWERLYNKYVTYLTTIASHYYLRFGAQQIMDKYFNYTGWEDRPSIEVLTRNRSLVLLNAHYVSGFPFPTAPHVKLIGGINIKPGKPLPEDIQKFMDEAKHGVIYLSFGSNINVSDHMIYTKHFMTVFAELKQRILLKYDKEYPTEIPSNVKIYKWLPQQEILAHKNCLLFITHGGFLSMNEAIYFGVPILGVPFFGDQPKNLLFAESSGFARIVRLKNLTETSVTWALDEMLTNPRYKEEIMKRSKMLKDVRHSPAEDAAYWIEHVLKYPNILVGGLPNFTSIELHNLDTNAFLSVVIYVLLIILNAILRLISMFIRKNWWRIPKILRYNSKKNQNNDENNQNDDENIQNDDEGIQNNDEDIQINDEDIQKNDKKTKNKDKKKQNNDNKGHKNKEKNS